VELTGALWNLYKDPGYLKKVLDLKERLLSGSKRPKGVVQEPVKPRPVAVLETVKHVLSLADKPMRAKEIQTACVQLLAKPVKMNSIAHCLYRHSQGQQSMFLKAGWGLYELRTEVEPYGLGLRRRRYPGR